MRRPLRVSSSTPLFVLQLCHGHVPQRVTPVLFLVLLAGCAGGDGIVLPGEGEPAAIAVVDGDEQRGRVGEPLSQPLVVQVTDSRGRPVEGATVAFEFGSAGPGAAVVPQEKTTDGDGLADARLVLGTSVGRQTGQARVVLQQGSEPIQASFSAMALSENANSMAAVAGQDQTGHVGLPLDDRLVVEVTDGFGNPVAGVPISWEAVGGGSVSETVVETDENGRSRVDRTLGPTVGQQTTVASAEGLAGSPVTFVHTALAGDASRLVIIAGNDQTGAVGSTLPGELVVQLIDADGNGVPQTAVSWVVATGGGAATPQNSTTDADGRTSARWTLGGTLGQQRLDAVVSGVGVATFRATATAGPPAALFIRTQPSASAENGVRLDRQPVLQLRDSQGNDVAQAGVQVTVAIGSGGGELGGTRQVSTDGSGQATFTNLSISGGAGRRTLVFSATGYAQVTSSEIDLEEIGTTTTITGDSPDPSQVGTPFTVSFRVTSRGPTPTGSVTVSDGNQSCSGTLSNGAGSCPLTLTNEGERTLTATYSGAPGLLGSSDTEEHRVTAAPPPPPATTSTTITSDTPDPSVSGSTFTVSFRVTSGGGTPTGSVRVTVSGGSQDCTGSLSGGSGSCPLTLNGAGDRTLTATYSGAPGFSPSSATEAHTVEAAPPPPPPPPATTTTTITSDTPDPSVSGSTFTVSFRVTSGGGTPVGNVTVSVSGGSPSCTGSLSGGSGSCPLTLNGVGDRTLTATYSGAAGFAASSDTEPHKVDAAPPENEAPFADFNWHCEGLTCHFTDASRDDDGNETIVSRSWNFGDGTPRSNAVNPSHTYAAAGDYTVTLTVTDNGGLTDDSSDKVNPKAPPPATTSTTITSDAPDPSVSGSTFTVNFQVTSGGSTPTGNVRVTVSGGSQECTGSLSGGTGSCQLTLDGAGNRTLTATYSGASGFAPSSDTESHTVTASNEPPEADFNWHCDGLTCDFTDRSEDDDGSIVSRSWNFGDGTPPSNQVNPSHTYPAAGDYTVTLTVTDNGGLTDVSSDKVNPQAPPPATTSTTITSDTPDPSVSGSTFTVNFQVTSGGGTPTGSVRVTVSGGSPTCTGNLSGGSGSCQLTLGTVGDRTLTATYSGASGFAPSSDTEPHTVTQAPPPDPGSLRLRTQPPSRTESDKRLEPEPEIELLDAAGNAAQIPGVSVSVAANTAQLQGQTTRSTDDRGRARFGELRIRGEEGTSVTLAFSAPGFASVDSQSILIENDDDDDDDDD